MLFDGTGGFRTHVHFKLFILYIHKFNFLDTILEWNHYRSISQESRNKQNFFLYS
jgi:hypothetical protein